MSVMVDERKMFVSGKTLCAPTAGKVPDFICPGQRLSVCGRKKKCAERGIHPQNALQLGFRLRQMHALRQTPDQGIF